MILHDNSVNSGDVGSSLVCKKSLTDKRGDSGDVCCSEAEEIFNCFSK